MSDPFPDLRGPFTADQIRQGDPYELSNGHPIRCMGTGGRGSDASAVGAAVLKSDPDVEEAGVDTGYSPKPGILRAPDVAVGNVPKQPGWVEGVPPLAVEYADTGQDEADLKNENQGAARRRHAVDLGGAIDRPTAGGGPRARQACAPSAFGRGACGAGDSAQSRARGRALRLGGRQPRKPCATCFSARATRISTPSAPRAGPKVK